MSGRSTMVRAGLIICVPAIAGCAAIQSATEAVVSAAGDAMGAMHSALSGSSSSGADEETIALAGNVEKREVDISPAAHERAGLEPLHVYIESAEEQVQVSIGRLSGSADEALRNALAEAVLAVVVGQSFGDRMDSYRPVVVVDDPGGAERCDAYARVAVTSLSFQESSESRQGQGSSGAHGGSASSEVDVEQLAVEVRVRFYEHGTDRLIATGYGRAVRESQTGRSDASGRGGSHAGSGSQSTARSSILSGPNAMDLSGRAASAAIIDALEDLDARFWPVDDQTAAG
ncbi:MAG: hypothetical protein AAFX79_12670 [Planctomycetota bacterium]